MTEPIGVGLSATPAPSADGAMLRDFSRETLVVLRRDVRGYGVQHGLSGLALYRFVVAVNELTTNAVRHAGGAGRLELRRVGDLLRCRVTDTGPGMPPGRRHIDALPAPDAVNGRGLWLARRNAHSVDIDSGPAGTTVTLTIRLR
ncbi:MAG TPA: ATP-binding protein [Catenuloplanes sp.]|jgi:anti-sigma regulatory factor (Ser/Thr protein kinase)